MLSFGAVANYLHLGKTEFVNHATPFDFQAKLTPAAGDRTAAAAVGAAADASLGTAAKAKTPSKEEIAAAVGAGSSGPLAVICTSCTPTATCGLRSRAKSGHERLACPPQ